jgi:hypothetical protein
MGTMMKHVGVMGLALAISACGGEAPKQEKAADAVPEILAGGLYEVSAEVTTLASTDNSTPATKLKQGDKTTTKACVSADGKPDPALLAEEGDKCEIKNSYIRFGRMSAQMSCTRAGSQGLVMPAMMGSYTADGFEGDINTLTYFVADGDYRMSRKVTAKRVGDCPAGGVAENAAEEAKS